jgi:hypothetical protein
VGPTPVEQNQSERIRAIHRQGNASRSGGMDSQQILSFYMGKNTAQWKDYILENLVVTAEE